MSDLSNKRVVITGGSSGIGLVTAQLLVEHGARALITGRTQATLEAAVGRLGDQAVAVRSDASSMAEVAALAGRVREEWGGCDGLVVAAGVTAAAPLETMDEDTYDRMFTVNAKGPYFTVQRLAPLLTPGSGIVLTTSVADVKGNPMVSAYAASKAALRSMTRSLARELLPHHLRVNAVSPGPIDTGILDRSMPAAAAEQMKAQMTANNPMQRFGDPVEVAKAVRYLLFDATFTTGAELPVDGGVSQL